MAKVDQAVLTGTGLVVVYTLMISSADAITKFIANGYAAPQLFALSGVIVSTLSWGTARFGNTPQSLRTSCPRAMALRAMLTVIGSIAFFYAFRWLPFAEVFVFIGMMPIFAAIFSAPVLKEHARPMAWAALVAGFIGVLCLFPSGLMSVSIGHLVAVFACLCGTMSMVLARYIGKFETNALAQVFYPNMALGVTMAMALPFVYVAMPVTDLLWVVCYGIFLFAARWLLVVSLRLMAAYAVTPLMNLQFVWMVVIGAVIFGEIPAANVYLGVAIVIGSGIFLIYEQLQPKPAPYPWANWLKARQLDVMQKIKIAR